MADATIRAVITADDRASRVISGFGGKVKQTARRVGFAATAAASALVGFGASSIKAFSESQDSITQLNAVLKSTKGIAGVTANSAIQLASSLQAVTKFSDEEILSAENLLLTFTKIGKDIFPQATETVLNMSQALGQDLKSSSIQLGKALQDPILGITALRRVGVNFNDSQKEVVKRLVETGQHAKAQALIMKELQTEFGNSARMAGTTFAGKVAILGNQFNDLKEKIGLTLVKSLGPFIAKISKWVATHPKEIENAIKTIASMIIFLGKTFAFIGRVIGGVSNALSKVILFFWKVADVARAVADRIVGFFQNIPQRIGGIFTGILKGIGNFLLPGKPFRQHGGPVQAGKPYIVGEAGPELVVPGQSGTVVPNDKLGSASGASNINFNVNIGLFAGTKMERRQIAKVLFKDFQDVARQFGVSPTTLLDSTNGARIR